MTTSYQYQQQPTLKALLAGTILGLVTSGLVMSALGLKPTTHTTGMTVATKMHTNPIDSRNPPTAGPPRYQPDHR